MPRQRERAWHNVRQGVGTNHDQARPPPERVHVIAPRFDLRPSSDAAEAPSVFFFVPSSFVYLGSPQVPAGLFQALAGHYLRHPAGESHALSQAPRRFILGPRGFI